MAEVVNYLVESSTADYVVLRFETDHHGFRLEGTTGVDIDESGGRVDDRATDDSAVDSAVDDSAIDDGAVDDLLHAVLGATTDDYRIGIVESHRYVSLKKQRAPETRASIDPSADASAPGSE